MDISRSIAGNAAWARLLGKPASDLIGRLDADLLPQELAADFRRHDQAMLASGQNERNEEWVTYPDGRRALLDTLKAPLRDPVTPLATSTCAPRWNHCGEPSGGA